MLIEKMRNQSQGVISKVIVYSIILVFALFGFGQITTFLIPTQKVAEVGSRDITQQEFDVTLERSRRLIKMQNREAADPDETVLRKEVLDLMIDRAILQAAAEDFGLYYGAELINSDILETPAFLIDGKFSEDQFRSLLANLGYTPTSFKEEMVEDRKIQQLKDAMRKTSFMTYSESIEASTLAQQQRNIAFLLIEVASLMDKEAVTEEETRLHYEMYSDEYMTEEMINIEYLEIKREDLMSEIKVSDEDVRNYYSASKEDYQQPERYRFAHILIEVGDKQEAATSLERIKEIQKQLVAGEDFGELAKRYSEDKLSAVEGGDLGFQLKDTFVPEFEEAGYLLEVNQISEPVLTEFGYHLIKLLEVEEEVIPEFEIVRDQIEKDIRDQKSGEQFLDISARMGMAYEVKGLEEPAEELGLEIKSTGLIKRDTSEGIGGSEQVMDVAFSRDILEDGNNSDVIEITPDHHVVIRVVDHKSRELRDYETVREGIVGTIALEKARREAEERAAVITGMLEEGSSTRFVADEYGLEWQKVENAIRTQLGLPREINEKAFLLPRPSKGGKSVGYGVLPDGNAFVVSVTSVKTLEGDTLLPQDTRNISRVLARGKGEAILSQFKSYITEDRDIWIKDNL